MEFRTIKISQIAKVYSGFAFKRENLGSNGIPVIKIKNVNQKKVNKQCGDYFPKELVTEKLTKYFLQSEDILVAMTGQGSLGRIGKMFNKNTDYLVNQRVGIIRTNANECDYLYAVLALNTYENQIFAIGMGAGQPNVSAKDIGNLEIPYPEIEIRKKIGEIRKKFDTLIENLNNQDEHYQRIIYTLFRSWFIDFDPVKEKAEGKLPYIMDKETAVLFPDTFENSELGPIPSGWDIGRIGDIASISSGKHQPERSEKKTLEYKVPLLGGAGIIAWTTESLFDEPIIVIGRVGTLGVVNKYTTPVWPSDNTLIFSTQKNSSFHYLLQLLKLQDFEAYNRGSTQPLLTQSDMKKLKIIIPSEGVLQAFEEKIHSMTLLSDLLEEKRESLAKTRDALLPRLMSGELSIS